MQLLSSVGSWETSTSVTPCVLTELALGNAMAAAVAMMEFPAAAATTSTTRETFDLFYSALVESHKEEEG